MSYVSIFTILSTIHGANYYYYLYKYMEIYLSNIPLFYTYNHCLMI